VFGLFENISKSSWINFRDVQRSFKKLFVDHPDPLNLHQDLPCISVSIGFIYIEFFVKRVFS